MGAFGSAISGLQASQQWLDVISNNVSNSQTVAYKSGRVSFSDLVSQGLKSASGSDTTDNLGGINPSQLGLGVEVSTVQLELSEGATQITGSVTDLAIQGSGFLTVRKGADTLYTRAGNLTYDNSGDLVTPDGGLVQGWSLTRNITFVAGVWTIQPGTLNTSDPSAIGNIQIPSNLVLGPQATSNQLSEANKTQGIILKGNLDNNTPQNANAAAGLAAAGATADATTTAVVYDSLGTAHTMTLAFFQGALTPANPAVWNLFVYDTTGNVAPSAANQLANFNGITFNPDGSLATNASGVPGTNLTVADVLTNGAVTPFNFSINLGTDNVAGPNGIGERDGMTGDYGNGTFSSAGAYQPVQTAYTALVDGYSEGTLTGLSYDQTGGINASFSNNQTLTLAKLAIGIFSNPSGLSRAGDNYFQTTANSGTSQIVTAGSNGAGTTQGGALEASNVDLTVELTNMIVAQRMFEANSRVVSVESSVLQTLTQLGQGG